MLPDARIEDYSYDLPPERIAAYPLSKRDNSRLLISREGMISESLFSRIDEHLDQGSMLVLNNTRVVQARLLFKKDSGASIEVFCLEPVHPVRDVHRSLSLPSPVEWHCLIGNARKWKDGELVFQNPGHSFSLQVEKLEKNHDDYRLRFSWEPQELSFGEVLEMAGQTPLPPYMNRRAEASDKQTYQTVYARPEGSVAAPTAGLHFTEDVFRKLSGRQIRIHQLTLHVGAGTFKPVSSETISSHEMHREQFCVEKTLLQSLVTHRGSINSVGTTSMRTLESLYWIGLRLCNGYEPSQTYVSLDQWFPYTWDGTMPPRKVVMQRIIDWLDEKKLDELQGETSLIIVPGYRFQVVDALITNFHQPRSTLLLLVAAFTGQAWKEAYRYALHNGFRFLSYGDSCLFFRKNHPVESSFANNDMPDTAGF